MSGLLHLYALLLCVGHSFSAKLKFYISQDVETHVAITDKHGTGAVFEGIGGISGGGATSKLVINYPKKHRDEILDFLFKPDYAASLQILKVEIGGDSQSTDGSESSHMHEPDNENYHSGYEWWLMKEAKQRNPDIKLYGLPWVFPGWLSDENNEPYRNLTSLATYIIKWIEGAKIHHNLDIDYIGIWNERHVKAEFVKLFRKMLNGRNLSHVQIVVPDASDWSIADELIEDPDYLNSIDIIGQHYPGARSPSKALKLGKKLWSSEDFSSVNDIEGGGCWARVLNEGPVLGHYSAFIAWNLITSYYEGLPYSHCSLMTANQPWSGHYFVGSPIWASAHHTYFYQPGWKYLPDGSGVGQFNGNGTYITLVSPDYSDLTIVISTMDPRKARCLYRMPEYTISSLQIAYFKLDDRFASIKSLNVWYTQIDYEEHTNSHFFEELAPLEVVNGQFSLTLMQNTIITLTTINKRKPSNFPNPPESKSFPVPYYEDFEYMGVGEEPANFAQQSGAYEVTLANDQKHGHVMTQVVVRPPVDTCWTRMGVPPNLIGDYYWRNVHVKVDAFIDKGDKHAASGVFLASQVNSGGCDLVIREGIYFWVNVSKGTTELCLNHNCSYSASKDVLTRNLYNVWFTMSLDVQGMDIVAKIDDQTIFNVTVKQFYSDHGFVVLGPNNFGKASFDKFAITRASKASNFAKQEQSIKPRYKS